MSEFTRCVISKWIVSYLLFKIFFEIFEYFIPYTNFDPSGHLCCAIVAYSNWVQINIYFLKNQNYIKVNIINETIVITTILLIY